jgi:hypothetical protein
VVANEPSNPAFQPLFTTNVDGSKSYNLDFADLSDKVAKVYETTGAGTNTSWVNNLLGAGPFTFADFASFEIEPPPVSYILAGNGVGSGAPDDINTNVAMGFNWVFGDTLSNYQSDGTGYIVSDFAVAPAPASAALFGIGGMLAFRRRR